ncbi:hypothetical protein ACHAWF_017439 [Thalassiosira exigua]
MSIARATNPLSRRSWNSRRALRRALPSARSMEAFSADAAASSSPSSSSSSPIVELRQYRLHPSQASLYARHTVRSAPLRKELPLAFFGVPETGGTPLNTAVHLYHYPGGHVERSERRAALAKKDEWKEYLGEVKACMMQQSSGIFVEAGLINDFDEVVGLKYWVDNDTVAVDKSDNKGIVELRKYQLKLGYDTVPKFLKLYSDALPSKLNATGTHATTQLVTILVSDVGSLNVVYEVWKHGGRLGAEEGVHCGMRAMEQSRQASRGAREWRRGIAQIAELAVTFDTTILKPLEFSPLR